MSTVPDLSTILQSNGIDTTGLECLTGVDDEAVYYLPIPGVEAIARWQILRALVPRTGYWPVILGTQDHLEWHVMELREHRDLPSPEVLLEAARNVDAETWFVEAARRVNLERQIAGELIMAAIPDDEVVEEDVLDAKVDELLSTRTVTLDDLLDLWPSSVKPRRTFDITGRYVWDFRKRTPRKTVYVRFVPTIESRFVPAYLRWGGFNSCPTPYAQVSVLGRWEQQYGSEVIGIWPDAIELAVRQPPTTRIDALKLAAEQYVYCPDIIDQGTGSIATLAALLSGGIAWSFWWD